MKKRLRSDFNRRQYMLSQDYEIYYYEDLHHMNVDPHVHTYYEFYVYLDGDVDFEIEGRRNKLIKGDCILVPPGIEHRAFVNNADIAYRRVIVWTSPEYMESLIERYEEFGCLKEHFQDSSGYLLHTDPITFNSIWGKVVSMLEELNGNSYGRETAIELKMQEMLLDISRLVHAASNPEHPETEKTLYQSLLEYIDSHLDEKLTLDRLSEVFYVNKYHIAHVFKENLAISIHQYMLKKRLASCREALLLGEKISEVYTNYGFRDYPGFFRAFKKEYGLSPQEYRKLYAVRNYSGDVSDNKKP